MNAVREFLRTYVDFVIVAGILLVLGVVGIVGYGLGQSHSQPPQVAAEPQVVQSAQPQVAKAVSVPVVVVVPDPVVQEAAQRGRLTKEYWNTFSAAFSSLGQVAGASQQQKCQAVRRMARNIQGIPAIGVDTELVQAASVFARTSLVYADEQDPDTQAAWFIQALGEMATTGDQSIGWKKMAEQRRVIQEFVDSCEKIDSLSSVLASRYGTQFPLMRVSK